MYTSAAFKRASIGSVLSAASLPEEPDEGGGEEEEKEGGVQEVLLRRSVISFPPLTSPRPVAASVSGVERPTSTVSLPPESTSTAAAGKASTGPTLARVRVGSSSGVSHSVQRWSFDGRSSKTLAGASFSLSSPASPTISPTISASTSPHQSPSKRALSRARGLARTFQPKMTPAVSGRTLGRREGPSVEEVLSAELKTNDDDGAGRGQPVRRPSSRAATNRQPLSFSADLDLAGGQRRSVETSAPPFPVAAATASDSPSFKPALTVDVDKKDDSQRLRHAEKLASRKRRVVNELIASEQAYVEGLEVVVEVRIPPSLRPAIGVVGLRGCWAAWLLG